MDGLDQIALDEALETLVAFGITCEALFYGAIDLAVSRGECREEMFVDAVEICSDLFVATKQSSDIFMQRQRWITILLVSAENREEFDRLFDIFTGELAVQLDE